MYTICDLQKILIFGTAMSRSGRSAPFSSSLMRRSFRLKKRYEPEPLRPAPAHFKHWLLSSLAWFSAIRFNFHSKMNEAQDEWREIRLHFNHWLEVELEVELDFELDFESS